MRSDCETKEKLLTSARSEFMEKGYAKSSLRKICANAGVTTGALYFFFKDKEDLFLSVVKKPYCELLDMLKSHFAMDKQFLSDMGIYTYDDHSHGDFARMLIHHLYANREAFLLILTKSQGTDFENCIDELVEMLEQGYREIAESVSAKSPEVEINSYTLHWMVHMNIDAFIHLLTHEPNEEKAFLQIKKIMDYLAKGWVELVISSKEEETE